MIIVTKVKTGARKDSIVYKEADNVYQISVKARPIDGKANQAIIELISKELNIPKTDITLKSGSKSKIKLFEV